MATIVHITADYPDAFAPGKTPAVANFLALTPHFRHVVYSLNRVNGISGASILEFRDDVATIVYHAPPFGLRLEHGLAPVARLIAEDLARRDLKPDLLHAHKLTIDGIVANSLSTTLACPMICNVWGNTDQKIIERKPLSRSHFKAIADRAAAVLPATPWASDFAVAALGIDPRKVRVIPVVSTVAPAMSSAAAPGRVATLFNLDGYAGKNVGALIAAVALLRQRGRSVELDIFGGGSPASINAVERLIRRAGGEAFVRLRGPLAHADVQKTLNLYAAFAMPSRRETFGMVFIEALFAGVPILYPKGQAIDGFFDTVDIGGKCDSGSTLDIADQLGRILVAEQSLKQTILELHRTDFFRVFDRNAIGMAYRDVVANALGQAGRPGTGQGDPWSQAATARG